MFNIGGKVKIDQHATVLAERLLRLRKDQDPRLQRFVDLGARADLLDDKAHITRYDSEAELNDHYNVLRRRVVADVSHH